MEFTGKLENISRTWEGKVQLTFSVNEKWAEPQIETIKDCKLSVKAVKYREKRSLDANALLWKCLGDIAGALRTDKWSVYLLMLRRYGQYTYICVLPEAVPMIKKQWREIEEVGDIDIHGKRAIQLLCYYGSSTYDTRQFSILLDGVISEMKEMNLETPSSEETRRILEQYSKNRE